jgi:ribosomal protein S18 acetylase RimI-like enzyme
MRELAMNVTSRPLTNEDEPFVRGLIFAIAGAELGAAAWPEALRDSLLDMQYRARKQSLQQNFPSAEQEILLLDTEPAGWSVIDRSEDAIQLIDIAVATEMRGRGVATWRIRQLQAEAESAGRRLRLSVVVTNPAIELYQRLGFRRTGGDAVRHHMEWPAGYAKTL